MAKPVGAFQLFGPSKEAVLNNFMSFLFIIFLPGFLILIGDAMNVSDYLASSENSLMQQFDLENTNPESRPYYVFGGIFTMLLIPARYYLQLQAAKGKEIDVAQAIRNSAKYFWRVIGFSFLFGLLVFLGLLALILPGLIVIRRYFLTPYFLIDQNLGIKDAMAASAQVSKLHSRAIWGVIGVTILLSIFNIIPVWGGLITLILTTLYSCAPALRYLELSKHAAKIHHPKS